MPNPCSNKLVVTNEGWEKFYKENTNADGFLDFDISIPCGGLRANAYDLWNAEIMHSDKWDKSNSIHFYSRWCPPKQFFLTISKKYPNLCFTLYYDEFAMDINGISHFEDGGEWEESVDVCEYLKEVHNIDKDSVILSLHGAFDEIYSNGETDTCDIEYEVIQIVEATEYYESLYLSHSRDIDIEKEWEKFKADKKEKDK